MTSGMASGTAPGIEGGTLHGVSLSPFVRKVRAALSWKGIDYTLENVMPGAMDAAFLIRSPLSKIPVWSEGDWSLPDSSVICAYLERRVPDPKLYPGDSRTFAEALFWEEYADTRLVESSTPVFFQRFVRKRVFMQEPDEEIVRRHLEEVLPPVFDQLEQLYVARDGENGETLTIGNLSVWSPFVNLSHVGVEIDAARWPGLSAFLTRMGEHDVLRALVDEERAALATS